MSKTDPINPANPAGSSDPKIGDDYIRTLARAVAEILGIDHYVGDNTGSGYDEDAAGQHSKITFQAPQSDHPTAVANKAHLYTKDIDGRPEVYFQDEDGNHYQLTENGKLKLDSAFMPVNTYLLGANTAGDGFVNLIMSDGESPVIGVSGKIIDAPTNQYHIANKKYVDDAIDNYLNVTNEQSSGVDGGSLTVDTWNKRTLNTTKVNNIDGASLGSSQLTLPAGTYRVNVSCVVKRDEGNLQTQLRLYDTTGHSVSLLGLSMYKDQGSNEEPSVTLTLAGRFTLSEESVIELQNNTNDTCTNGQGKATGFGTEVYANVELWKL